MVSPGLMQLLPQTGLRLTCRSRPRAGLRCSAAHMGPETGVAARGGVVAVNYLQSGYTLNRQRFEDNARELEAALALVRKAAGSEDSEQNRVKRSALDAWVKGVNAKGGFGVWCCDVAFQPAQIQDIIEKHAKQAADSRHRV